MANIKPYVDAISNAVYGEEVRGAIINALEKVNDDNNSYQDIKKEIVQARDEVKEEVASFDAKMETARQIDSELTETVLAGNAANDELKDSIRSGSTLKAGLDADIQEANRLKSEIPVVIQSAGNAKEALEEAVETADSHKRDLDASNETASETNETLSQTVKNADNKNTVLNGTIDTATQKNNTLIQSIGTAEQRKTALDGASETADNKKTLLDQSITAAGTSKTALDGSKAAADTSKKNLDESKAAADTSKQNLDKTIADAGTAKTDLVTTGETVKSEIQTSANTATEKKTALDSANSTATKNLSDLKEAEGKAREILVGVEDIKAYLGYTDEDIVGIQVDYKNKSFQRLAGAYGLNGGADFDKFEMFGGRKRCNLADNGTINAFYGDAGYTEDGSNGQVMVYQPKFYYKVVPLVIDPISDGVGYHLRKANYYVSTKPKTGFKLHPAFYDANGNEIDHIFFSAFEGSIYDVSASAYLLHDEQVADFNNDLFCSIAGVKPASGLTQNLTRPNIEALAKKRGAGWHGDLIRPESANQLLMMIEMGTMNLQTAIGQGVVSVSDNSAYSCTSLTGSTSAIGNGTGRASETVNEINGVQNTYTNDGRTSVTYRGMENPWGNIWKFVYDVNIWGNGSMKGGVPFVCTDFNFAESKNSGNYESAGFTLTNASGYISAMGYGDEKYDWLFFASETAGSSALPVGDYTYVTANLNGYRVAHLGGGWPYGDGAGAFCWDVDSSVGYRRRTVGGRLVYIPTAEAA